VGTDEPVEARRPGRPRDARADEAIIDATLHLLGQGGIAGVSIEAVAATAGVGKATIYRRWPSKEALVLHAMLLGTDQPPTPDTGSLRGDLEAYLLDLVERIRAFRHQDVLPHLVGAASYDPTVRSALSDYTRARQAPMRAVLQRAAARGDLPLGTDHDVFTDAVLGAINYRRLMSAGPVDADFVRALIDTLLAARPELGPADR
jgi:AcrR family transcriptional regulator